MLKGLREAWADHVNQRLAELDIDARVEHRNFAAQGIGLEPQHKIGPAAARMAGDGLEAERLEDHARIARENGEKIIARPAIALAMITRQQATFTERDLAIFIHRHSDGKTQFDQAVSAVRASPELVGLGTDAGGQLRFTSRSMIAIEAQLEHAASAMAERGRHAVAARHRSAALETAEARGLVLSGQQRAAFEHVAGKEGLAIVVGYAGSGKSAMLGVARTAWEAEGLTVRGAAPSGIAAENLEGGAGIASRTLASLEHQWGQDRELLTARDVLVIDEAGMIGSRQLQRVLSAAERAGAKVVLVGDPEQLQAIEAGAAFRSIVKRHGAAEITEIRRQREDWQRDATQALATGRTGEAIDAYQQHGMVHAADTREQARGELIEGWDRARQAEPDKSRIILTHTNAEVRDLNRLARGRLRDRGELGGDVTVTTERGERALASGDRVMFPKNKRGMGVKNGTLGTIERVSPNRMAVRLDDERQVAFDVKEYAHVDHGYAATFHKAQGLTLDGAHVLVTPGMDRHSAYVGLSRHGDNVQLHDGRDEFGDQDQLVRTLSRDRAKDMAGDYSRDFAERRGIDARERHDPGAARDQIIQRHARTVSAIFQMQEQGRDLLPSQAPALQAARAELIKLDSHAAADVERAYKDDPSLAHEAASGRTARAIHAMQLEAEVRASPALRADRFVDRWRKLDAQRTGAYQKGDCDGMRRIRDSMGAMAKGLKRDPQLESVLATRKQALGISADSGPNIGRSLAMSIRSDIGRGFGTGM